MKQLTISFKIDRYYFPEAAQGILGTIFFQRLFGLNLPSCKEFLNVSYPCCKNAILQSFIDDKIRIIESLIKDDTDTNLSRESSYEDLSLEFQNRKSSRQPYSTIILTIKFFDNKTQISKEQSNNKITEVQAKRRIYNVFEKLVCSSSKEDSSKESQTASNIGCWEQWVVKFHIMSGTTRDEIENLKYRNDVCNRFRNVLLQILEFSTQNIENIPPINYSKNCSLLSFKIELSLE